MAVYDKAVGAGVLVQLITDRGLTEFGGVPNRICLAVGPDYDDRARPGDRRPGTVLTMGILTDDMKRLVEEQEARLPRHRLPGLARRTSPMTARRPKRRCSNPSAPASLDSTTAAASRLPPESG